MAITKIVDDMRTTTVVDATKLAGTVAEARLATLDATKLTGTVDNARISLDAAEIPSLDASKITTGTVADARIPNLDAAKITTGDIALARLGNVPPSDTTGIQKDIALMALHTAINGNLSAFGLKNSWIEQFENSTYIENLSTTNRHTADEHMSSGTVGTAAYTDSYSTGNRNSIITLTQGGNFFTNSAHGMDLVNGNTSSGNSYLWNGTGFVDATMQFKFATGKIVQGVRTRANQNYNHKFRLEASMNGEDWITIGASAYATWPTEIWTGLSNQVAYTYYRFYATVNGYTSGPELHEVEFKIAPINLNATGSFESTDVVPEDAANKSSIGLVVLYKDKVGTATPNTHLIGKVRANTGQSYDSGSNTVVLALDRTYSDGMKVAIAPAISVTAGQALSYKIEFAGQGGSYETQVYGVAMTY